LRHLGVAAVSAAHIDRLNIRQATLTAMHRAIVGIGIDCAVAIDGRDTPPGLANATACIGGDAQVPQIAAASIIAKVLRDALMTRLARRHPGYGWEHNAGYGTAEHLSALARVGPTAHHRYSFAPVKKEKEKGLRREGA
jgi:ribonuclease HII